MRHVTDGELHAFLDGALDDLAEERGREISAHLEDCAVCRERLRDEEEVRSRAQGFLDEAAPSVGPLPSFESIRARAAGPEQSRTRDRNRTHFRGPLRGMPLAWAATVVLALGVGWMGGEIWDSRPGVGSREGLLYQREQDPTSEIDSADPDALGLADADRAPAGGGPPLDPSSRSPSAPLQGELAGVAKATGAGQEENLKALGSPGAEADATRAGLEPPASGLSPSRADAPAEELRRSAAIPSPSPALIPSPEATADREEESGVFLRSRTVAEDRTMLVPGLEVLAVEWEEWAPGERALYIRQLLPLGDTLELRYLGLLVGSEPRSMEGIVTRGQTSEPTLDRPVSPKVMEASLPPGWNQVVMRWGRGWIVARAPLTAESLRGIVRSLH
jgi:hypothetical protein